MKTKDCASEYRRSNTDDEVFTSVMATTIRKLMEMPDPYPQFGDMLRFFACIDFNKSEDVLNAMINNYLIAKLKNGGISERS